MIRSIEVWEGGDATAESLQPDFDPDKFVLKPTAWVAWVYTDEAMFAVDLPSSLEGEELKRFCETDVIAQINRGIRGFPLGKKD